MLSRYSAGEGGFIMSTSIMEALTVAAQTSKEAQRILREAETYADLQRRKAQQRRWWAWSRRQDAKA
jgi:hypothetical protein